VSPQDLAAIRRAGSGANAAGPAAPGRSPPVSRRAFPHPSSQRISAVFQGACGGYLTGASNRNGLASTLL
jgi:hypothetical protein